MKQAVSVLFFFPLIALAQNESAPTIAAPVSGSSNGPAVDRAGAAVIDPTRNVLDLVHALEKRLEDVQILTSKDIETRFKSREEVTKLQSEITELKTSHNSELIKLRSEYQVMLDANESKRIDSIRSVDQAAVKNESDRAQQAVNTLATAQSATAETLRSAVNTTATNIATQLDRTTSAIVERIASLEKAQYTGAGRSTVADPAIEALRARVEQLSANQQQGTGKTAGYESSWGILIAIVGGIGVIVVIMSRRHPV